MTDLILCQGRVTDKPYYFMGVGVNIYSIEELCFLLVQNAYILDEDTMDPKLCDFMRNELNMEALADKLSRLIEERKSVGEFVTTILSDTHYCEDEDLRAVRQTLVDNSSLSIPLKRKVRGDKLLKARKYTAALDEYQYVLRNLEKDEDPQLYGGILHNIGTAYAKLFLMQKAADYYKKSYETYANDESLVQYLIAVRMFTKKEQYDRLILRNGYRDEIVAEVEKRIRYAQARPEESEYSRALDEIKNLKDSGKISECYKKIDKTLENWKLDYRRNMSMHRA